MGDLLELGPQRDMEPHYMVCLCSLSACKGYQGLEREEGGLCRHLRFFINCLSLLGCKFCPAGSSCLRIMNNPKNVFGLYFSGQLQDFAQRQGKTGWTKHSILFYVCEYLDRRFRRSI